MAVVVLTCLRKRVVLRDRESGEVFRVASIGQRYVRYRALRGSGRGTVLRELLDELFEITELNAATSGGAPCNNWR
ncbi:MAG: hypothetical protein VB131_01345 [Burkholderia gladioli]